MPANLSIILDALDFAAKKHRDQRRKDADATPYINHPIELARLLVNKAGIEDTNMICAALLHDTVEDTETTEQELKEFFGREIAVIVMEVTDDKSLAKQERKRMQVAHVADCSEAAKLVKLADKICNLRDLDHSPPAGWTTERKQQYFDWAREVIEQIRGVNSVLERLFDEAYSRRP
jgi:guanosine-3',5'-bis(diphosphate) 3'-pyrophosphohydrolase